MIKTKRIRIRKSSIELFNECLYRANALLLGKSKEFYDLKQDKDLSLSLSKLVSILREVKTAIVEKHLKEELESKRSKELSSTLDIIDKLVDKEVLILNV